LADWLLINPILHNEQAGFQSNRNMQENVFILTEIIRDYRSRRKSLYVCFLDIKKAFDTVWRDALLFKLWHYGIKGKLWRLIRNYYSRTRCSVRVNQAYTDYFEILKGVRQGCVLSPVLYVIFINDLIRELKNSEINVKRNDISLNSLFFADDIVLMADSKYNMNKLLDIVYKYAMKWRFEINISKSKYMVFGRESKLDKININGESLDKVNSYKYLGYDIDSKLNWKVHQTRVLNAAKKRFYLMFSFNSFRRISVKSIIYAWNMLIRPKFEYGFELWYYKSIYNFECFQREVARRILRVSSKTTNEAVLGELGWYEIIDRADIAKLKLYYSFLSKGDDNICKQVLISQLSTPRKSSWTYTLFKLLQSLNLHEYDLSLMSKIEWKSKVTTTIYHRAQQKWLANMSLKPKLRLYVQVKSELNMNDIWTIWTLVSSC